MQDEFAQLRASAPSPDARRRVPGPTAVASRSHGVDLLARAMYWKTGWPGDWKTYDNALTNTTDAAIAHGHATGVTMHASRRCIKKPRIAAGLLRLRYCVLRASAGSEIHAAHAAHATAGRHRRLVLLRCIGHHGFGGDHQAGDRRCVLQR